MSNHLRHWQWKLPRKPDVQLLFARRSPRVAPRFCGTIHCVCPWLWPRSLNPAEQLSKGIKKTHKGIASNLSQSKHYSLFEIFDFPETMCFFGQIKRFFILIVSLTEDSTYLTLRYN